MAVNQKNLAAFETVFAYKAPFLIEKLTKDHIADTSEEAEALFTEVKKYLLLVANDPITTWEMYSVRVDEAWHQFILYTNEYMDFCERFFGRYLPHSPSNAPGLPLAEPTQEVCSFELFTSHYQKLFGAPLPDLWYDERSITPKRRVLNGYRGDLSLKDSGEIVELVAREGNAVFSVNSFARDALAFASRTGAFYVRELPGDLTDEEKVALVSTLVEAGILRVGT